MGITSRSERRRMAQLVDEVGAENRFQFALEAAWRGWVKPR